MTELLVSVRDHIEAQAAIEGGASIIDVKEPRNGPLGFAGIAAVDQIARALPAEIPLSVALGEATDWLNGLRPADGRLQSSPTFAKLGLAGRNGSDWTEHWLDVRQLCENELFNDVKPLWIAVAYADHIQANSPEPRRVMEAAVETGCRGFLLDTFVKDGRGTLQQLDVLELQDLRETAKKSNLLFALAGQIGLENASTAMGLRPDVVAIRGAACARNDRVASVSAASVNRFREAMHRAPEKTRI